MEKVETDESVVETGESTSVESDSKPKPRRVEVVIQQRKTSGKGIASILFAFLSFLCSFLAWLPSVMLGISVLRDVKKQPLLKGKILAMVSMVFATIGLFVNGLAAVIFGLPALQTMRLMETRENLAKIGTAMHHYESAHQELPHSGSTEPIEQPHSSAGYGLSWRVRLLPFLEHENLFKEFNVNEDWQSEHNQNNVSKMPDVYKSPLAHNKEFKTTYCAVVGAESRNKREQPPYSRAAFAHDKNPRRLRSFIDGLSNVVWIVEVPPSKAVLWSKPQDFNYDPNNPRKGLEGSNSPVFTFLMGDGSVRAVAKNVDDEILRRMFCINDGVPLDAEIEQE